MLIFFHQMTSSHITSSPRRGTEVPPSSTGLVAIDHLGATCYAKFLAFLSAKCPWSKCLSSSQPSFCSPRGVPSGCASPRWTSGPWHFGTSQGHTRAPFGPNTRCRTRTQNDHPQKTPQNRTPKTRKKPKK